ncbi:unnamed protein product [Rotaria socialis]|uniref:Uncharacterized protein n=2 Tax=Rotaria socialis TaxID=392032 RepID=A0A818JFH0_9BILA|nr:unnamed protein product [Rotaria socialis]CAF3535055.1 unnamed protein product [Rotaria socialis]CAF3582910.1 unnamed protein product [Rotaria socialis]
MYIQENDRYNVTHMLPFLEAILQCEEYVQYSNCSIAYLDHPSTFFIQIHDVVGPVFQQMHQDMNRYYWNSKTTTIFNLKNLE